MKPNMVVSLQKGGFQDTHKPGQGTNVHRLKHIFSCTSTISRTLLAPQIHTEAQFQDNTGKV